MQPNTRKLALVLSLGMALSACGGGDGSSAAPESSVTTKVAPADTSSSEATPSTAAATQDSAAAQNDTGAQNDASAQNAANGQDASGTQNTTDTQNTATAQGTTATQDTATAAAATPAATSTTDAIRTTDDGKNYEIRGDLLIQILLSHVPERSAANAPLLPWIDADESTDDPDKYKMTGPALLVDEDITPNADNAGRYIFRLAIDKGPIHGALEQAKHYMIIGQSTRPDIRIDLSLPGMPRNGTSAPVTSPLEIGQQLTVAPSRDGSDSAPQSTTEQTLTSKEVSTIDPKAWYPLSWAHAWEGSSHRTYRWISLKVSQADDAPLNQVNSCIDFTAEYNESENLCERWEIPAGWTSGQPLKHVRWTANRKYFSQFGGSTSYWHWNDDKGTPPISRTDQRTTSEPINSRGISGAVLSALLDAYTPRAGGMNALPQRAGGATDVYSTTPENNDPAFASLHHESRATSYADGNLDGTGYSPAVGPYAYTLKAGAWQSATDLYGPGKTLLGMELKLNLQNDAQKGLILPRSTSLTLQQRDINGNVAPLYQGEQNSQGNAEKTIAPNDLIQFGSRVQTWTAAKADPDNRAETPASVWLTIEQSLGDTRSVDLCWNAKTPDRYYPVVVYCTTSTIPEGWTAGQPLLPQSYHAAQHDYRITAFWNTRIAH